MSYYKHHFVNVLNEDTFYRTFLRTEGLGISKSAIEPVLCFNRILIPTKNIDIILFQARSWFVQGRVETVSLFTSSGIYDLDRFNIINVDNATESDFIELNYTVFDKGAFYAIIEKDVLQKVCEAESLAIRVTQKEDYESSYKVISFDDKKKYYLSPSIKVPSRVTLLTYFRAVYNSFCDKTAWPECEEMVQYSFFQRLIGD